MNEVKVTHSLQEVKGMNVYEKLTFVQAKLVSKKDKENTQLRSKYRTVDSILEALKPLSIEYRLNIRFKEDIIALGNMETKQISTDKNNNPTETVENGNRFYIKSIITITNIDKPDEVITNEGLSREAAFKKGVQVEMLSGMATTYARKYALAGLFIIADNDALDPDSIIDEQSNFEEKNEKLEHLYKSFEQDILNSTVLDDSYRALMKRIRASHLSKVKKEILETLYVTKGQELNKTE